MLYSPRLKWPAMAQWARGIGAFLLIPGIVLLAAGLLAAAFGYFGMESATANHHDGLLYNNDRDTRERMEMSQVMIVGGLSAAAAGLILSTVGGAVMAGSGRNEVVLVERQTS